jgi:hypothetical protein
MTTKKALIVLGGVAAALAVLVALFVGAVVGAAFYSIGNSQAAVTAKDFLRNSEKLKQDIGEVTDFGYIVTGSVNIQNSDGRATLNLKVIGENRTVNATVSMSYKNGQAWRVTDASYQNEAGQVIELLDPYGPQAPSKA